jgi:hypothetical protein
MMVMQMHDHSNLTYGSIPSKRHHQSKSPSKLGPFDWQPFVKQIRTLERDTFHDSLPGTFRITFLVADSDPAVANESAFVNASINTER